MNFDLRTMMDEATRARYDELLSEGVPPAEAIARATREKQSAVDMPPSVLPMAEGPRVAPVEPTMSPMAEEPDTQEKDGGVMGLLFGEGADKGDVIFKALQTLGGIGGGIAADRATRRADEETARRQSVANLINTLRGSRTASVSPKAPTLGLGGRFLSGLSTLGQAGTDLRETSRGVTQQELENERAQAKSELEEEQWEKTFSREGSQFEIERGLAERDLNIKEWNAVTNRIKNLGGSGPNQPSPSDIKSLGNSAGAAGRGVGETPYKDLETTITEASAGLPQHWDEHSREAYKNAVRQGWDNAQNKHAENVRAAKGLGLQKTRVDLEQARFDQSEDEWDWKTQNDINKNFIDGAKSSANNIKQDVISGLEVEGFTPKFKGLSDVIAEHELAMTRVKGSKKVLSEVTRKQARDIMEAAYKEGLNEVNARLSKRGMDDTIRYHLSQKKALLAKLKFYESKVLEKAGATGPWWGRIPAFQYFLPNDAVAEDFIEGFAIEVASILNDGRPTKEDAAAARAMIPDRQDTDVVAAQKMRNMIDLAQITINSIIEGFPVPLMVYIQDDGTFNKKMVQDKALSGVLDNEQKGILRKRAANGDKSAEALLQSLGEGNQAKSQVIKYPNDISPDDSGQQPIYDYTDSTSTTTTTWGKPPKQNNGR